MCFISNVGKVYPCGYLPVSAGDTRTQPFNEIWNSSEVFGRLRNPDAYEGKCGVCRYEAICGGCCSCATCHVILDQAWVDKVPARSIDEKELVEQTRGYKGDRSRLSCQIPATAALDGLTVELQLDAIEG